MATGCEPVAYSKYTLIFVSLLESLLEVVSNQCGIIIIIIIILLKNSTKAQQNFVFKSKCATDKIFPWVLCQKTNNYSLFYQSVIWAQPTWPCIPSVIIL